jgi:hypothetical protein
MHINKIWKHGSKCGKLFPVKNVHCSETLKFVEGHAFHRTLLQFEKPWEGKREPGTVTRRRISLLVEPF